MPGLRLTPAQAERLFALDRSCCMRILAECVRAGWLRRTMTGSYALVEAAP
jgi:hypothetical protein